MTDIGRGLPLLSGPPPPPESSNAEACRKCNKEFNIIFARARKCNHCGHSYCHSCSDYQALMPRTGAETGYDAMNVCACCIEFLTMTAAGRNQLKAQPLAKLKKYINAYNIKIDRAVEKDDLIDAIIAARQPNGCLPQSNENFYRKYSVPNKAPNRTRGLFSRSGQGSNAPPPPVPPRPATTSRDEFARPDLEPDNPPPQSYPYRNPQPQAYQQPQPQYNPPPHPPPQQQQYNPPPHPPPRPHSAYTNAPPPANNAPPHFYTPPPRPAPPNTGYPPYHGYGYQQQQQAPPPQPSQYSRPPPHQQDYPYRPNPPPRQTRPPPTQTQHAPAPPPPQSRPRAPSSAPPPPLDQLLNMTRESIGSLSIGALKEILFTNHVNAGQILEKGDLVSKVLTLIEDEKRERERQRQAEEWEEMERVQRLEEARRERDQRAERERERDAADTSHESADGPNFDASMDGSDDHEDGTHDHTHNIPPPVSSSPPKAAPTPPRMQGSAMTLDRTGLCVICQDEEANIAIVDCGHMAMCRGCSELIMSSSRECPLCRTRIITEARLLRIFKS